MPSLHIFLHNDLMYCYTLSNTTFLKLEYEIDLYYLHIELFSADSLINQTEIIIVESEGF
jgi:hypothetical protein